MTKRKKLPTPTFENIFTVAIQDLAADFLKNSTFKNSGTKGSERERSVQGFFEEHLPGAYAVTSGEVVDLQDRQSPQLDVMIYDKMRNYAFYSGDSHILPAEALLASVEVKSKLTRNEVKKSLVAAKKLRKLRPFKQRLSHVRDGGEEADGKARYFHCIFAYETDLSETGWLASEYKRYEDVAEEEGICPSVIDRIYVANRGLISPAFSKGLIEDRLSGYGLMHFYMHLWNFLDRENGRRKTAPYLDYAGSLSKGWKKI